MQTKVKTVLITGASQGLGYEFAKVFAAHGNSLIVVARSTEKLERIKQELEHTHSITVHSISKDLSSPHAAQELFDEIKKKQLEVDVLVNNAGFATHGLFVSLPLPEELEEIQLNVTTLTTLTKLFLPEMVRKKSGKILNIASTAAFQPGPLMAVYYATKAYVLSFSEALSVELQDTGVTVTALCPGATHTGFADRAQMNKTRLFQHAMTASDVARAGYHGLMSGKRVVIPGAINWWGAMLSSLIPRSWSMRVVKRMQE